MARNDAKTAALAVALAGGKTHSEAAESVGLSRKTVQRRLADPAFRQRIENLRSDMLARALGKMSDGMSIAADTLRELLAARSEAVRLGSARTLLELGARLRETLDLAQRVAELEQRAAEEQSLDPVAQD